MTRLIESLQEPSETRLIITLILQMSKLSSERLRKIVELLSAWPALLSSVVLWASCSSFYSPVPSPAP